LDSRQIGAQSANCVGGATKPRRHPLDPIDASAEHSRLASVEALHATGDACYEASRFSWERKCMRKIITSIAAGSLLALGACNQSAEEQTADAIEQNAEDTADAIEEQSDAANVSDAGEDALENQADAVREQGAEEADAVRNTN
jgi:hypothetical protein